MNHSEYPQEADKMVEQSEVDKVRSLLIEELRKSIRVYTSQGTKPWVNEQNALDLIAQLQEKKPGTIQGPFWSEVFAEALDKAGFVEGGPEWNEVWKRIESGE